MFFFPLWTRGQRGQRFFKRGTVSRCREIDTLYRGISGGIIRRFKAFVARKRWLKGCSYSGHPIVSRFGTRDSFWSMKLEV